jgi:predicted O-methyltransferase YrrM
LKVFSDMSLYMASSQQDHKEYGELYQLCRQIEGVEYIGAVAQPLLAEQLREVAMLAYSNTFPETSCISVLEAMASGCRIVTSELGALPETTAGFAELIPVDRGPQEYEKRFVDAAVAALQSLDSPATAELLSAQVRHVNQNYDWDQRAKEWERWLTDLPAGSHRYTPVSVEQTLPVAHLPRNNEPMDPYFGQFLGLLRRALSNGGSEFGLGLMLFSLAAGIRAATIIEIGRFKGFSTLALASALKLADIGWDQPAMTKQRPDVNYNALEGPKRRQLISIDPFPTPQARALIDEANLTNYVTMIDRRSDVVTIDGVADLIFIDGDHRYEACLNDVRRFVPKHLRPGGYFVLHDYYGWYDAQRKSASPVRKVIEQLVAEGQLQHLLIDTGYMSFVIFRKPDPAAAATLAKL